MNSRSLALCMAVAAVLAGCGDGSSGADPGGHREALIHHMGGHLDVINNGDVDYIDPGLTVFYGLSSALNRTLYTFAPGPGTTPVPDIAVAPPKISHDQRTLTIRLRAGVRFSPPVDREVTSDDVAYALERAFSANVGNFYISAYLGDVIGAPAKPGRIAAITGIRTPDRRTLVIRLDKPTAATVYQALALPISAPVPREYAAAFDRHAPSTYDKHVAFTGPYEVMHNSSGLLTGRRSGAIIELDRNPNWRRSTDTRPAYLDKISVREGDAIDLGLRHVLQGTGAVSGLDVTATPALLRLALRHHPAQVVSKNQGAMSFVSLNTTLKPLDDINVRRAILAIADRTLMRQTQGGPPAGTIATHFLPPGFPGFSEAGGIPGPGFDFLADPHGNAKVAARYMRSAGYPSGRYTGTKPLTIFASQSGGDRLLAETLVTQLHKLGFPVKAHFASPSVVYQFCGNPRAEIAVCPNDFWIKDFYDGQAMLDPTFNGRVINSTNNSNVSQLDDPKVNAAMTRAETLPAGEARNREWGRVDKLITGDAAALPWLWPTLNLFESRDVSGVANEWAGSWDLSYTSLR